METTPVPAGAREHPYAPLIALMDAAAAKPDEIDLRDEPFDAAEARRRASAPRPLPPYRRSHGYRGET